MITSRQNPRIKTLAGLQRGAGRRETGLSLAEGVRTAREALLYAEVETLVLSEKLGGPADELESLARERGVETLLVSESCYEKISRLETPEGAAAVVKIRKSSLEALLTPDCRLVVAAGLQDPGNAGAVVRAAEAAGATGCLFLDGIDPYHPRLLRAAAGAAFRLPLAAGTSGDFLATAKRNGVRVLAAAGAPDALRYDRADYSPPAAICIGGEGSGLPEEIVRGVDSLISIPMAGKVESLNAAVAAGVILYRAGWN